jgi:hypothetical protein
MKWLLIALGVALVAALVFWQANSSKTAYLNGLPLYRDLPNRQFIFECDCYIFKLKDHDTDWPLVATQLTVPELPAEVTENNVGADLPAVRILGIAHIGERFKIVSVRQDKNRRGSKITFEILFLDEASHKYARMDADDIMDHAPEAEGLAPTIRPDFAVAVAPQDQ